MTKKRDSSNIEQSLGQKTVGGGLATIAAQASSTIVSMVALMFLARMIDAGDFGLLAKVTALTGIVGLIGDMGLSLATIQSKTINDQQLSAFFYINVFVGFCLALSIAAASPLIGWFYHDGRVVMIAFVLSLNVFIGSLGVQHFAILRREMRFSIIAIIQVIALLLASVIAVVLANWFGYWALLAQLFCTTFFRTTGAWVVQKFRPTFRVFGTGIRQQLKMGGNFTLSRFVNYFARNADNVLIAKFWGEDALGYYSKAYGLLVMPLSQLAGPMSQVAIPALSRLQSEPENYRSFFRRGMSIALLLQLPITIFAAIAGSDIILTILGPKWEACIPIFIALIPNLIASATSPATSWVVLSTGQTARYLKIALFNSVVLVICFFVSVPYGILALAWTFSIASCLLRIPSILYVFKTAPVIPSDFFSLVPLPLIMSLVAGAGSFLVGALAPIEIAWLSLTAKAVTFAAIYIFLALKTDSGKTLLSHVMLKIRELRSRSAVTATT